MNNLDINENDDKLNLIKQIYKYHQVPNLRATFEERCLS